MIPTALKRLSRPTTSSAGNGRNHFKPREADLVALLAQPPYDHARGHGNGALADEDEIGVVGHVLLDERLLLAAGQLVVLLVGLANHLGRAAHRRVVLLADLGQPVLVDLRRDGDRVVGVEQPVAQVVARQELVDHALGRNLDQVLRVGQERAVGADRARQHDPRVLGDLVGDDRRVERFLAGFDPGHEPAQVAHRQRVVVFHAEGARIVQRPVADVGHHRQPQASGHRDGLEGVEPADARGADERPRADGAGVLDDLELRMLAFGDDVLAVHLAIGDHHRHGLHDGVVRADRIGRDDVDVGQPQRVGDGF